MKYRVLVCMLLTGCAGFTTALTGETACPTHSTSTPPVSESQLRAAWQARYGALPPTCDAHWDWAIVTPDELARACGKTLNAAGVWKDANACTTYTIGPNGTRMPGCPLTMTVAKWAGSRELATHEYAHWALHCASPSGDSDDTHTERPDVWGTGGFDGSFGP